MKNQKREIYPKNLEPIFEQVSVLEADFVNMNTNCFLTHPIIHYTC